MRGLVLLLAAALLPGQASAQGAMFDWFEYSGSDPADASLNVGASQYRNPVLSGFYPDPSNTRVGEDYYLVTSTFSYFPGIPVFHSKDLVNWTQIGNAIDRPDQLDFGKLGVSRGVFAPTIEEHAGTFYILNTCVDCGGNFVLTATNPAGPWSDPIWLPDLEGGIDPALFVDDDGSAWLVNNGPPEGTPEYEGHRAIWIQAFDLKTLKTFGPRKVLINGGVDFSKKPIWIEGPHIFRKDGYYYLSAAEGGTAVGHSQVILRSRSVTGPYEAYPGNPILTQRDLPEDRSFPITSAGHADLVETQKGEWWATFLAVRPYVGDYYNIGREVFLLPVRWEDGWPRITGPGEAISSVTRRPDLPAGATPAIPTFGPFTIRDEFDGKALPPYWMMLRNPRERWHWLSSGSLHLMPRTASLGGYGNPSYLGRRQQHLNASASTAMRFAPQIGDEAGIAAFQGDDHFYTFGLSRQGQDVVLNVSRRAGAQDPANGRLVASTPVVMAQRSPIQLRMDVRGGRIDFLYAISPGDWRTVLRDADATILSTRTAGGFVGTTFGPYALKKDGQDAR